ncbi:hypothetical protein OMK64_01830 [Cellulomonas fimi]|uniref:hypothetical protein n=1 Tax=Cellulomonas fimi TaxID=1708 RepID=UPI00234D9B7C|nr:hypothetical protein [Cellulomonas fimi]MDC7120272.1 hypothetical protein [Cellulomonas fimi]
MPETVTNEPLILDEYAAFPGARPDTAVLPASLRLRVVNRLVLREGRAPAFFTLRFPTDSEED